MYPTEYQRLAARTECDQEASRLRIVGGELRNDLAGLTPVRLNHAVIGLVGEVGELAAEVEHWLYYGQPLDDGNVHEELGDCLWYIALACNALGLDLGRVMEANVAKLRARYPEKYSDERAKEANRDRAAEARAAKGGRTFEEVKLAQAGPGGCCERFADNMTCDCAEEALVADGSRLVRRGSWEDPNVAPADRSGS